jgi:hypothetical protein
MEEKTTEQLNQERGERMKDLLIKLKRVNAVYGKATEEQRGKLLKACGHIFDELENYKYKREFLESLVIGGEDFLKSLGPTPDLNLYQQTELIFK